MEVSSFSTVPRFSYSCSSVTESSRFRGVKVHLWNQSLVQLSIRKRRTPGNLISCSQKRDVSVVDGSCMEEIYDKLAERIVPTSASMFSPNVKRLVGLAGPPGAGKSTLAKEVVRLVNKLWPQKASSFDEEVNPPDVAIVLPMDGFHLYRSQLDAMEVDLNLYSDELCFSLSYSLLLNRLFSLFRIPKKPMREEEVRSVRNYLLRTIFEIDFDPCVHLPAPWTFDPSLLLNCLKKLRNEGSVYVPSFDHGVGDPVEDDIFVSLQHKVVIVEGNYILLEDGSWKDISDMFDEKWFIDVNLDTAMERVESRHISTGKPPDVAKWRIDYNDRPNAELIMKSKTNADVLIRSINF